MGDVGKWPGMDEGGRAFQRLHQVGLMRVLHQHGQRTGRADVLGRDRLAGPVQCRYHAAEALAHVRQISWQSAKIAMISLATVMS